MPKLLRQFGETESNHELAHVLEHAHAVARGAEVAIRVFRESDVRRNLCLSGAMAPADGDCLLALVGAAVELLGDKLESLSERNLGHECRRIFIDEQSSRGNA